MGKVIKSQFGRDSRECIKPYLREKMMFTRERYLVRSTALRRFLSELVDLK